MDGYLSPLKARELSYFERLDLWDGIENFLLEDCRSETGDEFVGIRSRNICCVMGFLWSKVSESLEIFFKKKKVFEEIVELENSFFEKNSNLFFAI